MIHLARERTIVIHLARAAALRMALSEIRYFRCSVRHGRAHEERTRTRREYWRRTAIAYALDLDEDVDALERLGLAHVGLEITLAAADAVTAGRVAYVLRNRLDPLILDLTALAVETLPGHERVGLN